MSQGVAILEISALGAALLVLDAAEKAANVKLLQTELNDYYGYVIKLQGDASSLRAAVSSARETAHALHAECVTTIIDSPDLRSWPAIESPPEYQPLIEQSVVFFPQTIIQTDPETQSEDAPMATQENFAIGLIETQGFTAVIEAIDTACKAANVEVVGKEKLGGGYITILLRGDVAAVHAAVDAGKERVEGLGKLIAAHVIPRPSPGILALLPQRV